jgi:hypothetical protein
VSTVKWSVGYLTPCGLVGKVCKSERGTTTVRFTEPGALRSVMDERDHSCRSLAQMTEALERMDPQRYRASSYGLIGMVAAGKTRSIHDLRAAAIERALAVPAGSLFAARSVQRSVATDQDAA